MEHMCQYLRCQPLLRIWVLLMFLFLTLKGQDTGSSTMEEKINEIFIQIAKLWLHSHGVPLVPWPGTTGTQDVDLIPFPAQRMNVREVPFCFDFHMHNIPREYLLGSTISGQRLTHQPSANLPEYTAKQSPCLPDSFSKQEPNVRTLWPDFR